MQDAQSDARVEYLRAHIERQYHVSISELNQLDRGVFDTHLADGRRWVVRVFPTKRSIESVTADAAVLQFLAHHNFPAERCADTQPVSTLRDRAILVTEYVEGTNPTLNKSTLHTLASMLARLHMLPVEAGPVSREAGALHHYAQNGGAPHHDLLAAANWLADIENAVPTQNRSLYDALCEQIASADTCHNLPTALIHPDPVIKNILATQHKDLLFIDWTGAGRGPRIASLAVLIWSAALQKGGWSPARVDTVASGYRSLISLEQDELARLANIMRIRPLVFACRRYRHALTTAQQPDGSEWWWPDNELVNAIATSAQAALQS